MGSNLDPNHVITNKHSHNFKTMAVKSKGWNVKIVDKLVSFDLLQIRASSKFLSTISKDINIKYK